MGKEPVILFGAGKIGKQCAQMLRFDKEILFFIDNDSKKWGGTSHFTVYPVEHAKAYPDIRIIITMLDFAPAVMQLETMGLHSYVYFEDLYAWQLNCPSRQIMDQHIAERSIGQYTGRDVKNAWMNHMRWHYQDSSFEPLFAAGKKYLDMGCGCGTSLFHALLLGVDGYGLDCCQWKADFCKQKIDDFSFPQEWKKRVVWGYGEQLPFKDRFFDVVTCWYVLEHVTDWKACLREMVRVTRQGGVILLNAPDYRNTYEEHYGLDNGLSIVDHLEEWRTYLTEQHESLEIFDTLNFITKDMVLAELGNLPVKIFDREGDRVQVHRVKGKLRIHRRIDLVITVAS